MVGHDGMYCVGACACTTKGSRSTYFKLTSGRTERSNKDCVSSIHASQVIVVMLTSGHVVHLVVIVVGEPLISRKSIDRQLSFRKD